MYERESRGFVSYEEIWSHKLSQEECFTYLEDKNPCKRTIGAMQLQTYPLKPNMITLLTTLKKEKKLYVRLAICETLAFAQKEEALLMLPYLGRIGVNQILELPPQVSKKISYPLPRDLVARTMAYMDVKVVTSLCSQLHNMALSQVREFIDALGFSLFYHPLEEQRMDTLFRAIMLQLEVWKDDVLLWKLIQCASAFPCSVEWLEECVEKHEGIFHDEALRSLHLLQIKRRKKRKQSVCNIA